MFEFQGQNIDRFSSDEVPMVMVPTDEREA